MLRESVETLLMAEAGAERRSVYPRWREANNDDCEWLKDVSAFSRKRKARSSSRRPWGFQAPDWSPRSSELHPLI